MNHRIGGNLLKEAEWDKVQKGALLWKINQHSWKMRVLELRRQLGWLPLHQTQHSARLMPIFKAKNI